MLKFWFWTKFETRLTAKTKVWNQRSGFKLNFTDGIRPRNRLFCRSSSRLMVYFWLQSDEATSTDDDDVDDDESGFKAHYRNASI